jgi:hypothetical protein
MLPLQRIGPLRHRICVEAVEAPVAPETHSAGFDALYRRQ